MYCPACYIDTALADTIFKKTRLHRVADTRCEYHDWYTDYPVYYIVTALADSLFQDRSYTTPVIDMPVAALQL